MPARNCQENESKKQAARQAGLYCSSNTSGTLHGLSSNKVAEATCSQTQLARPHLPTTPNFDRHDGCLLQVDSAEQASITSQADRWQKRPPKSRFHPTPKMKPTWIPRVRWTEETCTSTSSSSSPHRPRDPPTISTVTRKIDIVPTICIHLTVSVSLAELHCAALLPILQSAHQSLPASVFGRTPPFRHRLSGED